MLSATANSFSFENRLRSTAALQACQSLAPSLLTESAQLHDHKHCTAVTLHQPHTKPGHLYDANGHDRGLASAVYRQQSAQVAQCDGYWAQPLPLLPFWCILAKPKMISRPHHQKGAGFLAKTRCLCGVQVCGAATRGAAHLISQADIPSVWPGARAACLSAGGVCLTQPGCLQSDCPLVDTPAD